MARVPPPPLPLFLDQTEVRRAKKISFGHRPPTFAPSPYLKVWIWHCEQVLSRGQFVRKSRVSAKLDGELPGGKISLNATQKGWFGSIVSR